jgi:hypothetical protein
VLHDFRLLTSEGGVAEDVAKDFSGFGHAAVLFELSGRVQGEYPGEKEEKKKRKEDGWGLRRHARIRREPLEAVQRLSASLQARKARAKGTFCPANGNTGQTPSFRDLAIP